MTDVGDLSRAVIDNPQETTPVAMLADHLSETDNGAGCILQHWLRSGNDRAEEQFPGYFDENVVDYRGHIPTGTAVATTVTPSTHNRVHWAVHVGGSGNSHVFRIEADHHTSREIADSFEGYAGAAAHHRLDAHFGPDPRYNDSLNKALKPEQE